MRHSVVPALLVTAIYAGFRLYGTKDRRLSKGLLIESLVFAACSFVVMWTYRNYWLREGMTTFGFNCPNGYQMVEDPSFPTQKTCKAVGYKTSSAETGFRGEMEK
jgi:hypothetical protein